MGSTSTTSSCARSDASRPTRLLASWRERCRELLVDEVQDVDRAQLRLALLLAAPANRIFLVGDDDQSIYGWRLADVRRILGLDAAPAGLRRVDLEVNYRCPRQVVERAVRLVEHNGERFAKSIRAGPAATGRIVLAPDPSDETVRLERAVRTWPNDGRPAPILARTNRELLPAVVVALRLGCRSGRRGSSSSSTRRSSTSCWIGRRKTPSRASRSWSRSVGSARTVLTTPRRPRSPRPFSAGRSATPIWRHSRLAVGETRARLAELRRDDAALTLATAHATKGLEFDHVVVVGMEVGRFPSARAVGQAEDPVRAYEEERRLAYVAWTRARRSLTLCYDPPSPPRSCSRRSAPRSSVSAPAPG